jgi:hypothetical protein
MMVKEFVPEKSIFIQLTLLITREDFINVSRRENFRSSSPSIVRVIKARRMRWAGHVARIGEVRGAYTILVGRP